MFLLTIAAASTSLVLLLYKFLIAPCFLSPLSKIPNAHFTAPFSDYWIERKRRSGQEVLTIYNLHRKHGSVVRLGPNELSVNSLRGLHTIYTGAFEKHSFYRDAFVNFLTDNLVGMLPNEPHARQKRMLSKIYSKSYLRESVDLRNISSIVLSQRLLPILQEVAEKGETINVLPLFQAVGMDFTSAFLFGTANSTTFLFDLPGWEKWLEEYERFKYLSLKERYMGFIESWCLSLCRRMQCNDHPNEVPVATNAVVYDQLRQELEKHPDQRPLDMAVASELLDHLVAGHETTGITFVYMMWELSQRPQLQAELRQELLTLTPPLSHPFVESSNEGLPILPSPAAIDSLPLLDAMVRETLRVHSPAPAPLPRVTPFTPEGIALEGYEGIPGGVRVEEIKLVMAAVYTNYTTSIVDDEGIEQDHAFISLPKGRKLMLSFTPVKLCHYAGLPHAIISILLGAVFRVWDLTQWIGTNLVGGVNGTRHAGVETTQTDRYEDGYLLHFGTARQQRPDDSLRALVFEAIKETGDHSRLDWVATDSLLDGFKKDWSTNTRRRQVMTKYHQLGALCSLALCHDWDLVEVVVASTAQRSESRYLSAGSLSRGESVSAHLDQDLPQLIGSLAAAIWHDSPLIVSGRFILSSAARLDADGYLRGGHGRRRLGVIFHVGFPGLKTASIYPQFFPTPRESPYQGRATLPLRRGRLMKREDRRPGQLRAGKDNLIPILVAGVPVLVADVPGLVPGDSVNRWKRDLIKWEKAEKGLAAVWQAIERTLVSEKSRLFELFDVRATLQVNPGLLPTCPGEELQPDMYAAGVG
ncbi:hypothetical protein CFD26_101772 [Aspergillus turcosus]|uniref:Uncharacterized protein n=1 Tax=Aspergillus turcosus TaxID=1245748 RepID=A0A3R7JCF4_9EURO|nr:hypothetical protein CFD26_101772 [Aspergillus turcosus]